VLYSHAESVNIELERELSVAEATKVLEGTLGVQVYPTVGEYPMQIQTAGTDEIHVGRIRKDLSVPHGLSLWIVADNVRKGAALNAVQIAERLIERFGA
jgi:aspartate-semialdehyde dehydrogenase